MKKPSNNRIAAGEVPLDTFVPHSSLVTPHIAKTKAGEYHTSFRVGGIAFETSDDGVVDINANALHGYLRAVSGGRVGLVQHKIRRRVSERLDAKFENAFCQELNDTYFDTFKGYRMMSVELYLTVVYRPEVSKLSGLLSKAKKRTRKEIERADAKAIEAVEEYAKTTLSMLRKFDVERLGTYTRTVKHFDGRLEQQLFSEQLELYSYVINGYWSRVPVRRTRISQYLPVTRPTFSDYSEFGELSTPVGKKYVAMIDFQDYPEWSEPGLTNAVLYGDYEYIETQSFLMLAKRDGLDVLERQKGYLLSGKDAATSQIDAIDQAMDDVASGLIEMGEYQYGLAVFGETLEEAKQNKSKAVAGLTETGGFRVVPVDTTPESAWLAQLPGNWRHRPRDAWVTSRNFAHFCSLHGFASGKRTGNPWGEAVTIFKTPNGQPNFFSFHVQPDDEDSTDKAYPANTVIIGQNGSGKTVVEMLLILQCFKFAGFRAVIFDKDRGTEIAVRAAGGRYFAIKIGQRTGWNPFQLEATPKNILFLEQLVKKLAEHPSFPFTPSEDIEISHAVNAVMRMPHEQRRLAAVRQNMQNVSENSVSARLAKWCNSGPLAWMFDNPIDTLDFTTGNLFGFDYTEFLDNPELRTPAMMYLLYVSESLIDGHPFAFVIAEFWKALEDSFFEDFSKNKLKTIRKQRGMGVFDTQSPADCLDSKIARTIVEQCVTKLFLPNPSADRGDYVDGFKLTEAEFEIVKNLGETSRCMLVKQGQRSAVVKLDLGGLDQILDVLSGSTDNVELLDTIRAEVGDDPADWLPVFRERLALRRSIGKSNQQNRRAA
ncbi:VirB4 family type IV secretion/conjugal transfer ATPase [Burkholderia ubonensis]|uniref:VirB4 family type IV secretion/conjugal transfer ATPase n=1 Tax=Burkholderia ubonensis TaxID=101571 RepID=UPI002AAF7915|nr:VirB4 family type IV secretion/conjugal transfer ATPase [Burkholderia ubonensis]